MVPQTLNGYPVIKSQQNSAGTVFTVMLHRKGNHIPFVVATWTQQLGDKWLRGFYEHTAADANAQFALVAEHNERG
jgi:hypothetical protein